MPSHAGRTRPSPRLARKMIETFVAEIPLYGLLPREAARGRDPRHHRGQPAAVLHHAARGAPPRQRRARRGSDVRRTSGRGAGAPRRGPVAVPRRWRASAGRRWPKARRRRRPRRFIAAVERVLPMCSRCPLRSRRPTWKSSRPSTARSATPVVGWHPHCSPVNPPTALAARLGVSIAPAYLVAALRIDAHPDEADRGVGGADRGPPQGQACTSALDAVARRTGDRTCSTRSAAPCCFRRPPRRCSIRAGELPELASTLRSRGWR